MFWRILREVKRIVKTNQTRQFYDINRLVIELGKGIRNRIFDVDYKKFGKLCKNYYLSSMTLQQESIFIFLHFWNKTFGIKDVGKMIGKLVWNGRYECLIKDF